MSTVFSVKPKLHLLLSCSPPRLTSRACLSNQRDNRQSALTLLGGSSDRNRFQSMLPSLRLPDIQGLSLCQDQGWIHGYTLYPVSPQYPTSLDQPGFLVHQIYGRRYTLRALQVPHRFYRPMCLLPLLELPDYWLRLLAQMTF